MTYKTSLRELEDRYNALKDEQARKKGALLEAVKQLKSDFGLETSEAAEKAIKKWEKNIRSWEEERENLMSELQELFDGPEEDDFDEFDD